MGTFKDASKSNPCPICGKSDWCSRFLPDDTSYIGQELPVCRRIQAMEIQSSVDGKTYYFVKEFSDTSVLYTDTPGSKDTYPRQKGYSFNPQAKPSVKTEDHGIPAKPNRELNHIYRDFLSHLTLSSKHYEYFRKEGWPEDLIANSHIVSLPLKKEYDTERALFTDQKERKNLMLLLQQNHPSLIGVPGFYQDDDDLWTFVGKAGILIPLYDKDQNICRLRLRLDHPERNENGKEKNKYKNFSTFLQKKDENGIWKNIYKNGCRAGSQVGIYFNPEADDPTTCYITEGEKKAMVSNYILKCIVISLPGVNTFAKLLEKDENGISILDFLLSIGCKRVVIAYDADKATNPAVLRCEEKLILLLKSYPFRIFTTYWKYGFGKGLDDILLVGIHPSKIPV